MFASVGPRGGPRPALAQAVPEPDLSHLTEEERKIILAVLARQREEEAKEEAMLNVSVHTHTCTGEASLSSHPHTHTHPQVKCLCPHTRTQTHTHQQLSSYRESVIRQASAAASGHRDDAPTCGICHKTKFANGCGNLCSYCHTKFCARCGGRVSLRSNTVSSVIWVCNNCRKQQELLTRPGDWFSSDSAALGSAVSEPSVCQRSRSQAPAPSIHDAPGSAPASLDPNRAAPPGGAAGDPRSRSEPPRDERNGRGGGAGSRGQSRLQTQVSVDRDLRGERERRESRRLTKGRSLEHDPVGGGGIKRTADQSGPVPAGGRGQAVQGQGLEGLGPGQGPGAGLQSQTNPPELREPPHGPAVRRTKREKAESMLRNDSLSSDQSESLRPPPPRPYKSKRGAGGKRQTSMSSSEEEGGTTPEYSSCEDAEIESISERGEWGAREEGERISLVKAEV
uniref:Regulating synaptic membrane exocytosis 1a n=1 Tax=Periophthalmus magnuspinnatus TaxID=409849 RepID=A0A3B4AV27_9GOBI